MTALRKKQATAWYPEAFSLTAQTGSNTIESVRAAGIVGAEIPWHAAVAIPARNEEKRIIRCLSALKSAIGAAGRRVGIVLVVNNSFDATHQRADRWLSRANIPYVLLDIDFADAYAFVGSARRLSLDLAADMVESEGLLFTTDADSAVDQRWIVDGFGEIRDGADLVCGTILRFEDEHEPLPAEIAERCAPESEYVALSVELAARLDPRPHDPFPAHWNVGGADLVFGRSLYEALGGIPVVASGEDRAFVAEAERHDHRVVFSPNVVVRTSFRLNGRAAGGMADSLVSWLVDQDPLCDERLFAAEASGRRFWLRGAIRRFGSSAAGDALLDALGLNLETERRTSSETFGKFWDRVDAHCFQVERGRMRVSDIVRELPALRTIVKRLRAGERPEDDVDQANAWFAQCVRGDVQPCLE